MRIFIKYLRPHTNRVMGCFTMKFLGTGADLFIPWILSYIIDVVVPQKDQQQVFLWGGLMLLIALSSLILNVVSNRLASAVSRDATDALRADLFDKITTLSAKQLDRFTVPSLETRLTSDTYNIHRIMGMMQRMGVRAPIMLIGGIIVTMTIEPRLSAVLIATLPFITLTVWMVSRKGLPLYGQLQRKTDGMIGVVRENITGIRIIKALSKTEDEKNRFHDWNEMVSNSEVKAATTMALTKPLINMLLNGGRTLVILVGAWCVYSGVAKTGALIAFMTYFTIILNSMMSITRIFVMYSKGNASALRIAEVLEAPVELEPMALETIKSKNFIQFDGVSFSYMGGENNLSDVSFSIHKGGTLGIIGGTASGKSTVLALLLRLYDPNCGCVFIDGKDIREMTRKELYQYFGVVRQGDSIFGDTVYNNIDFGRGITEHQLLKAVQTAQAEEFITQMPDGFGQRISTGGGNLSGGQKQRLLISRALAKEPAILVLDDSSSALDYKTDLLLRNGVRENYPDTTMIVVAQRISSVHQMDKIVVLDNGTVAGIGTHDELLEHCSIYQELYHSQRGDA